MRAKILLCSVLLMQGCSLLPLLKGMPFQIKAVIEGDIKGHKIHCAKTIDLADGKWNVMCKIGNDMDVKYRIKSMSRELAQIEFVVGKSKNGHNKIIASPTVVVKKAQSAQSITTTHNTNITVLAERVQ